MGTCRNRTGFTVGYDFTAGYRLYEEESLIEIRVDIENKRSHALPYLYLCHINFRPVDGAQLVYAVRNSPGCYTVHGPGGESSQPMEAFLNNLEGDLSAHDTVGAKGQCYDPEVCITLEYTADENGLGHTMQVLPDGNAHYVAHPVEALPMPVRWISRTGDEDAMGMVLPATAEHLGHANAARKGQVRTIPPHGHVAFVMKAGLLVPGDAETMRRHIADILAKEAGTA